MGNSKEAESKGVRLHIPLNRYALLSLYLVVVLLRGCTYWGWNGIQEMLYKSGAYMWECTNPETTTYMKIGDASYVDCPERKQMLGGVFTLALGSNLISSFFAGIVLDAVGPKVTMLLGILMDVVGWMLLGFSGQSFQGYYAAAFCMGVAADPGYLPLLPISKLFPKNSSFIISVLGSLRSVSFAVPVIMSVIFQGSAFAPDDLWRMCVGYVGVAQGISLVVTIFFVPMKHFAEPTESGTATEVGVGSADSDTATPGDNQKSADKTQPTKEEDNRSFFQLIADPKFLILLPIFGCALIRSDYYAKSNKEQLLELSSGRNLYNMFSICNILTFLPGPVMGFLVDKYGILLVLMILNTSGVLMYVFLMFDSLACKGVSILFYFLYTSFVISNVYCYISIHFPSRAFGKMTGFTSAFGGILVLLSILWYKKLMEYEYPTNFIVVDGIMVGIGIFVFLLVFCLWRIDVREKARRKVVDPQKTLDARVP